MHPVYEKVRQNMRQDGVWQRSRPDRHFIFCVGQGEARLQSFMDFAMRESIGVKPLSGMYRGEPEFCYISNVRDYERLIPWFKDQETVLLLGQRNSRNEPRATLQYVKNDMLVELGHLKHMHEAQAKHFRNWLYDPFQDAYFVCRK